LLDRLSLFCRDYLFPRFKFLSNDWQKYDAENENSLSYFFGAKMKMKRMNRYEDLWERVFLPTIRLKNQTIHCNLNNAINQIYKGVFALGSNMLFLLLIDACCKQLPTR